MQAHLVNPMVGNVRNDEPSLIEPFPNSARDAAMGGDIRALKELGDRIEGKTPQRTEPTGEEDAPSGLIIQWASD